MADVSKLLCAEIRRNLAARDRPRIPAGGELLWRWFSDLNRTRSQGLAGALPITFAEIEAYARLHRLAIEPRHVAILAAMDAAFLEAASATTMTPTVSPRPLSSKLFDAVFGG